MKRMTTVLTCGLFLALACLISTASAKVPGSGNGTGGGHGPGNGTGGGKYGNPQSSMNKASWGGYGGGMGKGTGGGYGMGNGQGGGKYGNNGPYVPSNGNTGTFPNYPKQDYPQYPNSHCNSGNCWPSSSNYPQFPQYPSGNCSSGNCWPKPNFPQYPQYPQNPSGNCSSGNCYPGQSYPQYPQYPSDSGWGGYGGSASNSFPMFK